MKLWGFHWSEPFRFAEKELEAHGIEPPRYYGIRWGNFQFGWWTPPRWIR